jgi:hypothetical protein
MSDALEAIIQDAESSIRGKLMAAFDAGREVGRQEASSELKAKLAGLLDIEERQVPYNVALAKSSAAKVVVATRAAQGSVKPMILKVIRERWGATSAEIQDATGAKYNSIRGTLWQLAHDGVIEKQGDKWIVRSQKNEAADGEPGEGSSTASVNNPAQGREAGPGGGI